MIVIYFMICISFKPLLYTFERHETLKGYLGFAKIKKTFQINLK